MRIGGWIVAFWAVAAWMMLLSSGPLGPIAAACVLVQAVIEFRALARHASLLVGTGAFVMAVSIAAYFFETPLRSISEAAARLVAVVLVAPLAAEHASGFWLTRFLQKAHLPRPFTLAIISSFSVFPVLLENVMTLVYHHSHMQGRRRLGVNALAATMVMALDRVQDMEVADHAFDIRGLLEKARGRRVARGELLYVAQLLVMAFAAYRVFLS